MASIGEVEHAPERSIRVWFGNLEERKISGIRRREREFIDRGKDAGVGDGPFQIS